MNATGKSSHHGSRPGRPPKYQTPEELQVQVDRYFKRVRRKPTITGLALFCGFDDRSSFYEQGREREGFSHTIKTASARVAESYEACLRNKHCTGAIFALKNFGWKDTPAPIVDQSTHVHRTIVFQEVAAPITPEGILEDTRHVPRP